MPTNTSVWQCAVTDARMVVGCVSRHGTTQQPGKLGLTSNGGPLLTPPPGSIHVENSHHVLEPCQQLGPVGTECHSVRRRHLVL